MPPWRCAHGPRWAGCPGDSAELRAENAQLRESVKRLQMLTQDKDAKIAELEEQVARLERLISRNSVNSSMPPSSDDLPGKKQPAPKPPRGGKRRPGKQPGAPGAFLAWNPDPDETQDLFPAGDCGCGRDLAAARDLGVKSSHQVTDLPEARARTTQYDEHEVECTCGARHLAAAPAEAGGPRRARSPTGLGSRPGASSSWSCTTSRSSAARASWSQ